jgi:hypothetical protein
MLDSIQPLRRAFRRSAFCNRLFSRILPLYRLVAVNPHTEVVIEGYPRCANTFAVVAFQMAQPNPVRIAHHLHSLAQLRRGVQMGIPTVALIREPNAATLSLAIRKKLADVRWAVDEYIDFYRGVVDLADNVLLADFVEVTDDFGAVIRRMNQRFGTAYAEFQHTEANVAACYEQIDRIEQRDAGGAVRPTHVARPSTERKAQKQLYAEQLRRAAIQPRIAEAERLYADLCRAHSIHLSSTSAHP